MAKNDNTLLWLGLGGALAALIFTQRKTIMVYGAQALEAGYEVYFKAVISDEAQPYADLILQVAKETGVDPFLIWALGQRESRWGEALSPSGPGGTGDSGHGRGIMQVDDRSFATWLAQNDWTDPLTNIRKGVAILQQKIAFLSTDAPVKGLTDGVNVTLSATQAARRNVKAGQYPDPRPLSGDALTQAAVAAYNTGEGNVLMSLAAGKSADSTTAGNDYLADVWQKMTDAAGEFQQQAAAGSSA